MSLTPESLLAQLQKLDIISTDQLASFIAPSSSATNGSNAIDLLVSQRLLTPYQAQLVREGRARDLVIGPYVVLEVIGAGGMGRVYQAVHRAMDRIVALKLLPDDSFQNAGAIRQFEREIKAAARLAHPNIVHVYDAGQSGRRHFLVMEYIDGTDLRSHVRRRGPLAVDEAVKIMVQVSLGLDYAHEKGVVHCDIKPENLLLTNEGSVKILDLGLARISTSRANGKDDGSSRVMGTVDFMSPEQAMKQPQIDGRADLYSLGCTLYFLLTGKPVYSGENALEVLVAHAANPIPSLKAARRDVPDALNRVFQRMMAKQPEHRYAGMRQLIADLQDCRLASFRMLGTVQHWTRTNSADTNLAAAAGPAKPPMAGAVPSNDALHETVIGESLLPRPHARPPRHGPIGMIAGATVLIGIVIAGALWMINWLPTRVPALVSLPRDNGATSAPDRQPPKHTPEAQAALWIFKKSGSLRVPTVQGGQLDIATLDLLPRERFEIIAIALESAAINDGELEILTRLEKLESLILSDTGITDAALAPLCQLPALARLELNDTAITDQACRILAKMASLQSLKLRNTRITDGSMGYLGYLRKLESLDLGKTAVTDAGLAYVQTMRRLKWLNLSQTAITDRGLPALKELRDLTSLELSSTKITDIGLTHLQTLTALQWLDLRDTPITDAGLKSLHGLAQLSLVLLNNSMVSSAGVAELRQKQPQCRVRH